MEIELKDVRVGLEPIAGRGQGVRKCSRPSGAGQHHCMRTIGAAEEALDLMCRQLQSHRLRQRLSEHSVWEQRVAEARIEIDCTRLLCLKAADMMDKVGSKAAKAEIAMIKVKAPRMALQVIDDAVQAFGGAGQPERRSPQAGPASAPAAR